MLSRVADSIFWMSRYIERAENVARFIDVNLHLRLDLPGLADEQWAPLVEASGDAADFTARYPEPSRRRVIEFLTFDPVNPNSIVACVAKARENARTVREMISSEMWEEINRFYLTLQDPASPRNALRTPLEFFQEVKRASRLIEGTKNETMAHGEAWHFSQMGRLLERADKTTRILDVKYFLLLPSVSDVGKPVDDLQWSAVLRSASAFEAYRKAYGLVSASRIVGFLIFDRDFPRSVLYCVTSSQESLHAITGTPLRKFSNAAERSIGRLVSELEYTDADDVMRGGLHEFLDALQMKLNGVGDCISETFFGRRVDGRPREMTTGADVPAANRGA